jgi:hypothetical protein
MFSHWQKDFQSGLSGIFMVLRIINQRVRIKKGEFSFIRVYFDKDYVALFRYIINQKVRIFLT